MASVHEKRGSGETGAQLHLPSGQPWVRCPPADGQPAPDVTGPLNRLGRSGGDARCLALRLLADAQSLEGQRLCKVILVMSRWNPSVSELSVPSVKSLVKPWAQRRRFAA